MRVWTPATIISELDAEFDLQDDAWVTTGEKLTYFKEAMERAQQIVHGIHLDYFKKSAYLPLVSGTSSYPLSSAISDIYATYIRQIFWSDTGFNQPNPNGDTYEVRKIWLNQTPMVDSSDDYSYDIQNTDPTTGPSIVIYPSPRETTSTKMQVWYIRACNALTLTSDPLDIPEAYLWIREFVKLKYMQKDKGNPLYPEIKANLKEQEQIFRTTLASMAPERTQGEIEADFSAYEEMY